MLAEQIESISQTSSNGPEFLLVGYEIEVPPPDLTLFPAEDVAIPDHEAQAVRVRLMVQRLASEAATCG